MSLFYPQYRTCVCGLSVSVGSFVTQSLKAGGDLSEFSEAQAECRLTLDMKERIAVFGSNCLTVGELRRTISATIIFLPQTTSNQRC